MIVDVGDDQLIDTDDRNVIHERAAVMSAPAWPPGQDGKPGRVAIDGWCLHRAVFIVAAGGARVFAFEPMVANYWRLGVNIALNKVFVTTKQCAVSDYEGTATLRYNPRVPLTTGASLEKGIAANAESVKTLCTTLDALAFQNVAAIKIDVERHDYPAGRGAMK